MIHFRRVLLLALLGAALAVRAADDPRFSSTLSAEQRTAAGLGQLTADNIAVIDGLVRQDLAATRYRNNGVDHTEFSQRRTDRERELAGLDHLTAAQRTRLDEFVRLRVADANAVFTATPVAAPAVMAGGESAVRTVKGTRAPEIHGSVSYTVGWSKAGSFQGGDLVLTYDDPDHRYSVLVAYSQYHGKGLPLCFYPGGGPYRPYNDLLLPP